MSSANGGRSRPTATTRILTVAILSGTMADEQQGPERHINIHFEPQHMAGHYANFANVSHSDHEVEDDEIPGVVVSRINLSPRFMRELIDAMEDNYSKWQTREGIKSLPEWGGPAGGGPEPPVAE